ncbi:MAG: hypothetical protein VKJ06_06295 [Vampirovibrionales bacterium]|nr:hypothetical protein [Vampirovibrionales bacterium]
MALPLLALATKALPMLKSLFKGGNPIDAIGKIFNPIKNLFSGLFGKKKGSKQAKLAQPGSPQVGGQQTVSKPSAPTIIVAPTQPAVGKQDPFQSGPNTLDIGGKDSKIDMAKLAETFNKLGIDPEVGKFAIKTANELGRPVTLQLAQMPQKSNPFSGTFNI